MKTFSPEVREMMLRSSSGYCEYPECHNKATEFHHKLPNTTVYQKRYPLFIHSPFNCMPICHGCHMNKTKISIPERLALQFEIWLQSIMKGKQ